MRNTMFVKNWNLLRLAAALVMLDPFFAFAGDQGLAVALGGMAFTNSIQQGGQGPQGSTVLTQADLVYHWGWYGIGGFFQYDLQGNSETDLTAGPKFEIHTGVFYLEGGWAPFMRKAYTDRSVARQTGHGWLTGVGARFALGTTGGSGSLFLQFSYKYRIQVVTQQDGQNISESITYKDGYPVFGIGYRF